MSKRRSVLQGYSVLVKRDKKWTRQETIKPDELEEYLKHLTKYEAVKFRPIFGRTQR